MPTPSAQDIIRIRLQVSVCFRVAVVVLLLVGSMWTLLRFPEYRNQIQVASMGMAPRPNVLDAAWFGIPVGLVGISVVLVLLSRYGMAFVVPAPEPRCPKCGYDLSDPSGNRCPECGLHIASVPANDPK